ncbi:hypothetical protein FQN49_008799, partial [Arthroderma sp. PD_2]
MSGGFSWCPTSIFAMPLQPLQSSHPPGSYLTISGDGSLQGRWRLGRLSPNIEGNLLWGNGTHPLIHRRLEHTIEQHRHGDKRCWLLAEPKGGRVARALLVIETEGNGDASEEKPRFDYVGALYFRESLTDEGWDTKTVTISGDGIDRDATLDHLSGKNSRAMDTPETMQQAVWRGDFGKVQELIEGEVDLEALDQVGRGALHLAAERGDKAMVDALLAKSSLKDYSKLKDGQGQTVLHHASWAGSTTVVKSWVQRGMDVSERDNDGNLALHLAACMGFELIVQLLLDFDISLVSAKGCNGSTPLHYAAMGGHEAVVQMLVVRGADEQVKDRIGWIPLHYAAGSGNVRAVELLARGKASPKTEHGWTPLHIAAMNGHEQAVKFLARNHADEIARDEYGWTPRRFAEMYLHPVAKLLPSEDTGANSRKYISWTRLHLLAIDNPRCLVKLLVNGEMGASLERIDQPLLFAAENGLHTATRRLLEMGSDVDGADEWKRTPLSLAAMNDHGTTVQVLLNAHATVSLRDDSGKEPLSWAVERGHEGVVELLLEKGAN